MWPIKVYFLLGSSIDLRSSLLGDRAGLIQAWFCSEYWNEAGSRKGTEATENRSKKFTESDVSPDKALKDLNNLTLDESE